MTTDNLLIFKLTKEQARRCHGLEQWVLKQLSTYPLLTEKHTDGRRPEELLPCGTLAYRVCWYNNRATLSLLPGDILVFCGTPEELHEERPERCPYSGDYKYTPSLFYSVLWVFSDDAEPEESRGISALARAKAARVTERMREFPGDWQRTWYAAPL